MPHKMAQALCHKELTLLAVTRAEGDSEAGLGGDEGVACPQEVRAGQVDHGGRCPGGAALADVSTEQAAGLQCQVQVLQEHNHVEVSEGSDALVWPVPYVMNARSRASTQHLTSV